MRVKHLDDLYTWEQIKKLRHVHDFNPDNGFVPIALYAPGWGRTSHYGGENDSYGWYGKHSAYCAKILWEKARQELAELERDALAYDIVEASECFNTIRFRNQTKARSYRDAFMNLLRELAENRELKAAFGPVPARPYPWNTSKRYEEKIIPDDAEYRPNWSHDNLPTYTETAFPGWAAVEHFFIELTESELAFLAGGETINRQPTEKDKELIAACRKLDIQKVARLLDAGANANATSGGFIPDTVMTETVETAFDCDEEGKRLQDASAIAELLLSHGCDPDLSAFDGPSPMYESIHYGLVFVKFLLEKGADVNAISWIGFDDGPFTPLDHVSNDIGAFGVEPYLEGTYELIESRGGKYFSELVPDFYET